MRKDETDQLRSPPNRSLQAIMEHLEKSRPFFVAMLAESVTNACGACPGCIRLFEAEGSVQ
jgi:hypothetical protein